VFILLKFLPIVSVRGHLSDEYLGFRFGGDFGGSAVAGDVSMRSAIFFIEPHR
jgi:hypothetical protein